MSETYDAVILGAGHNGLILQAYLARAGLSTICLERRDTPGGGLETIEYPAGSGFFHNTHSFYHRALDRVPWYADLELAQYGARYLEPLLNVAMVCRAGEVLQWWTDFEKTCASFARFSQQDADALRKWRDAFRPVVRDILVPEAQAPPLPPPDREKILQQTPAGRLLLETSRLSPLEFVQREFTHPAVKAGLLFFNGLREVDLRLPGFGHHIPALLASDGMAQICLGGSRRLADALLDVIRQAGGAVRTNVTLQHIVVENGRAAAIETRDGDVIRARQLIASSLNPQQTFLELIDPEHLPGEWIEKARGFQYNLLAPLFALHLNLEEAPKYAAAAAHPELDKALMVILGLDHVDQFHQIVAAHEAGRMPPTVMWGSSPSVFDPSQAPAGKHTAFMWEKLPYNLGGDPNTWDKEREKHGLEMLEIWRRYAPNLEHSVVDSFTRSPLDVERSLWNMQGGDLLVGAFSGGQVGYHRPFPGAGHYRAYLPGLYLCGSCCHPGGNVTGLPGYNCAQVAFADLGIAADWLPAPIEQRLARRM